MLSLLAKGLLFVFSHKVFKSQRELRQYPRVRFNQVNAAADNGTMRETWQACLNEITGQWPTDSAHVVKKSDEEINK